MELHIRDATINDANTIVQYNLNLARESEGLELNEGVLHDGVVRALEQPDYCRYFVAEVDGVVAAQTMLTYEWSDWKNGLIWWIQSVYVDPAYRRQGLFREIFKYLEKLAVENGEIVALRLYVHEHNLRAISTYEKLGMSQSEYLLFEKTIPLPQDNH